MRVEVWVSSPNSPHPRTRTWQNGPGPSRLTNTSRKALTSPDGQGPLPHAQL